LSGVEPPLSKSWQTNKPVALIRIVKELEFSRPFLWGNKLCELDDVIKKLKNGAMSITELLERIIQ